MNSSYKNRQLLVCSVIITSFTIDKKTIHRLPLMRHECQHSTPILTNAAEKELQSSYLIGQPKTVTTELRL
jgi:hypothetical protein